MKRMDCHLNSTIPPFLCRTTTTKGALSIPFPSPANRKKFDSLKVTLSLLSSCCSQNRRQKPVSAGAVSKPRVLETDAYNRVRIKTLDGCKIGVSNYCFEYNAIGGGGSGHSTKIEDNSLNGSVLVSFDPKALYIPPVTSATTKLHGWPFPPFLKIEIVPEILHGNIYEDSGKAEFNFRANFLFSVGIGYKASLLVETLLTSEESRGVYRTTKGKRLGKDGRCRLVGVVMLDPLKDDYINSLLGLPAECVTEMNSIISFL
ncbi:hypothetical protein Ancab_008902 [Ancistrocladus abbreviatus]